MRMVFAYDQRPLTIRLRTETTANLLMNSGGFRALFRSLALGYGATNVTQVTLSEAEKIGLRPQQKLRLIID